MATSFWVISIIVFTITVLICIPPVIRYYKKESGKSWERDRKLSIITILRGGLPVCALLTIGIMLAMKFFFY